MNKINFHSILLLLMIMGLNACKLKIEAPASTSTATTSASATLSSYTCQTYSGGTMYNSLTTCQGSGANCTSSYVTFPNGGSSTCYTPVAGYASCAANPPHWMYTASTVQAITSNGYILKQSLIGCSSSICLCTGAVVLETTIGSLPSPCTTASCGAYIYQGSLGISGLTFTLHTTPTVTTGIPAMSSDTAPTISVTQAPAGFTLNIYSDSTCLHILGTTTINGSGVGTTLSLPESGGGPKSFYATLTNGATTTTCSNTNVSYYQIVAPVLAQPTSVLIPSTGHAAGSAVILNFGNSDNNGMGYSCKYDSVVDGSASAGANCSTLAGASINASFNTSNGQLTWTPANSWTGKYEFCVTGNNSTNLPSTKCSAVYGMNNTTYSLTLSPAASGAPPVSTSTNPSINVLTGAPGGFTYFLYSDSSCSNLTGSVLLNAGGTGNVATAIASGGQINFYGKFQDPASQVYSSCISTQQSYYQVITPVLNHPTSLIFPTGQVKAGFPITLDFHATDPTGITYTCKYDRLVDNTAASGSLCSTLSGVSTNATFSSSALLSWTPPLTAYGPYEFCVSATQAATPNPTSSYCAIVDVVPNSLITANLSHYYDAQFALASGGQNTKPDKSLKDLVGTLNSTLNEWGNYGTNGWVGNGTTAAPYAIRMNNPDEPVWNFIDIHQSSNLSTNVNQSVAIDLWTKANGAPQNWNGWSGNYDTTVGVVLNYYLDTTDEGMRILMRPSGGGYKLTTFMKRPDGTSFESVNNTVYSYGSWYHLTVIWDQNNLTNTLYVNGVQVSSNTSLPAQNTFPIKARRLILGSDYTGQQYKFNGEIANMRFYDSANPAIPSINFNAEKQRFGY